MATMTQPKQKKITVPLNPILLSELLIRRLAASRLLQATFFPVFCLVAQKICKILVFFFPCLYIGHFPLMGLEGVFSI